MHGQGRAIVMGRMTLMTLYMHYTSLRNTVLRGGVVVLVCGAFCVVHGAVVALPNMGAVCAICSDETNRAHDKLLCEYVLHR